MATIKRAGVDRSTTYTPEEWEAISLRYTAQDGEVGQGSVPVPQTAGLEVYAGELFQLLVGATSVFEGFIGPLDRERGISATGNRLVDAYTVGDENAVLHGMRAHTWIRPVETTKARFLAFLADFVPWVTDTTWVTDDVVWAMSAKTYSTETVFDELYQEIQDFTGNVCFVENHRAHLHPATVGITGGLEFTDADADFSTTFPIYNPRRSKDPLDLRNDVMVTTPKHQATVTDATSITRHDSGGLKHQALVSIDHGDASDAASKATQILANVKAERVTYEFDTGPLTAAQLASIPVGCLVPITSSVMGLSASTQRIAAMTVSYRIGDKFMAHIECGYPVRIRKAAPRLGIVTPAATTSYAEIVYPEADDPSTTMATVALLNWSNDGDNPLSPRIAHPLTGLMAYDDTDVDASFPGDHTGIKMLGSGSVDIHCEAGFEIGYLSGSGKDVTLYVLLNGRVIGSAVHTDSGSGIHIVAGYIDVDLTDIQVGIGDIIKAELAWVATPHDGAIPIAGTTGDTYMSVTGDLTDPADYRSDLSGDLATPQTVVGIMDKPITRLVDKQPLAYDAATETMQPRPVEGLGTDATDAALVLAPDGAGGVEFRAETDGISPEGVATTYLRRLGLEWAVFQVVAASGAALTLDLSLANTFDITLTANCTLTFINPPPNAVEGKGALILRQGGTGSYTVTWPAAVKWRASNGTATTTAPTLATAVGAVDVVVLTTLDGGTTYGAALDNGVAALNDLTDVTIATPATGAKLRYDGSGWVNSSLHDEPMIASDGSVMTDGLLNPMMSEVPW